MQRAICLDFESTLAPEIWPEVAEATGIDELRLTTRDIPSFPLLMQKRIEILNREGVTLEDLLKVARNVKPLDGAVEFMRKVKKIIPKIFISSDLAEELALPMLHLLDNPTFFGNNFSINDDGTFGPFSYRQNNPKYELVRALQSTNLTVIAAGDSANDLPMLEQADHASLFGSTESFRKEHNIYPFASNYDELLRWIKEVAS